LPLSVTVTALRTTREKRLEKRAERLRAFFKPITTVAPVESSIRSEDMVW
jgi:hypothetical protein